MSLTVEIEGVEKQIKIGSIYLSTLTNGIDTLGVTIQSFDATYRPDNEDEIIFKKDGTAIFGGLIQDWEERAIGDDEGVGQTGHQIKITANDFSVLVSMRYLTETFPAGNTLKQWAQQFIDNYFSGVLTLHPSQVDGPTFTEDIQFILTQAQDVLGEFADRSGGYVWKVDALKRLRFFLPGSVSAPFSVNEAVKHTVGDIRSQYTKNDIGANRILLTVPGGGGPATDTFDFVSTDGVTIGSFIYFTTRYPASHNIEEAWPNVLIFDGVIQGPVAWTPDAVAADTIGWSWKPLVGVGAQLIYPIGSPAFFPGSGVHITGTYAIQYPFTIIANDLADQAIHGIREKRITVDRPMSLEAAQAYAEAQLGKSVEAHKLFYRTFDAGLEAGMSQDVDLAFRNTDTVYLINEIIIRDIDKDILQYAVTLVEGGQEQGTFRDTYRMWSQRNVGSTAPVGATTVPGGLNHSVQSNKAGSFYGDQNFLQYADGDGDRDYGTEDFPVRVAILAPNSFGGHLAILNSALSDDQAFTIWQRYSSGEGDTYIEQESGSIAIFTYGTGGASINISAAEWLTLDGEGRVKISSDTIVDTTPIAMEGIYYRTVTNSSAATVTVGDGVVFQCTQSTGVVTWNLPAVASAGAQFSSSRHRKYWFRHNGSGGTGVIDPNSSELIKIGASTFSTVTLNPGEWICLQNDGTLWWAIAGTQAGLGGGGTVPGSDSQIIYNNGGALGADANFVWNDTNQQLKITGDTSDDNSPLKVVNESTDSSMISFNPLSGGQATILFGAEFVGADQIVHTDRPGTLGKDATDMWMEVGVGETPGSPFSYPTGVGLGLSSSQNGIGYIYAYGMGTGAIPGATFEIGRNNGGSGAAGSLKLVDRSGSFNYLWSHLGEVHSHTARPTENDSVPHAGGTILLNWKRATVATTDATVTTIATIAVPATTTKAVEARVVARRTGGAGGAAEDGAYYVARAVYKNVAGTATQIGAEVSSTFESQAGWNLSWTQSAGNILLQVTGAATNNINWSVEYHEQTVS